VVADMMMEVGEVLEELVTESRIWFVMEVEMRIDLFS